MLEIDGSTTAGLAYTATAQQIQDAYQRFAFKNVQSGLSDVLRRYNNAVTLWHAHPQDSDLAVVLACLK